MRSNRNAGSEPARSRPRTSSRWRRPVVLIALLAWPCALPADADADEILLRDGSKLTGAIIEDPRRPDKVVILTEDSAEPTTLDRAEVRSVTPSPSPVKDYLEAVEQVDRTARSHYELGRWCIQEKLGELARKHFEIAVRLEPDFEPARSRLGQVLFNGQWITEDEMKQAQGLIRHEGRWVTPEEKARLEAEMVESKRERAIQSEVLRLIRIWNNAGTPVVRAEAEARLRNIREEAALAPLLSILRETADPTLRRLLLDILTNIPGSRADRILADLFMVLQNQDEAELVLQALSDRNTKPIQDRLAARLDSRDPATAGKAATALAELNATRLVPELVDALLSRRTEMKMVPRYEPPVAAPLVGVTQGPDGEPQTTVATTTMAFAAPGVAGQVPVPLMVGRPGGIRYERRLVTTIVQNQQVLAALNQLTRADFGYNLDAWKRWLRHEYNPRPERLRVVPQP